MRRIRQNGGYKRIELLLLFSKGAKSRLNILSTLRQRPKNCNEIAKELDFGWWTVQKHLKRMQRENLVKCEDFGRIKFYVLTTKGEEALTLCLEATTNCCNYCGVL